MKIDEIDKKIIYYYRNDFREKSMCVKLGISINSLRKRKTKLRKLGLLKKWWEE